MTSATDQTVKAGQIWASDALDRPVFLVQRVHGGYAECVGINQGVRDTSGVVCEIPLYLFGTPGGYWLLQGADETPEGPDVTDNAAREFLDWLIAMDDPQNVIGCETRRSVNLNQIIDRARTVRDRMDQGK